MTCIKYSNDLPPETGCRFVAAMQATITELASRNVSEDRP
jgi:hypothetical protein